MTSKKQAEANRRNALKSTGPKTQEGKDAVRLNAVRHGLLSQDVLLPGEDEAALKELGERLRAEVQPVGELESMLVDRIIAAHWRLRRLGRVEADIFIWEHYEELAKRALRPRTEQDDQIAALGRAFIRDAGMADAFSKLSRYEIAIERSLFKALHELQRLQAARQTNGNVPPPVAVDLNVSGISDDVR